MIIASRNSALYLKNGQQVYIEPANLFKDKFEVKVQGIGIMEVYPNRDSVSYIKIYGIPEAKTVFRGTFRFTGWCETLDTMKSLGMLDDSVKDYSGMTYADFIAERAKVRKDGLRKNISEKLGLSQSSVPLNALEWLGFFEEREMGYTKTTPLDITSDMMISKMSLSVDDRDMVILRHYFLASYPGGSKEVIKSSMLDFGSPATNTSIARTVALPAAIAVKLILKRKIELTGVQRPVLPQIYNPVLSELEKMNIKMNEEYGLPESEMIRL